MNHKLSKTPERHFHIRWANGKKDWEPHRTRAEAEESATQFEQSGETHAIEECHDSHAGNRHETLRKHVH